MQGRDWSSSFESVIKTVTGFPEMKDQIQIIQKEMIPLFNQIEQYIVDLSAFVDSFSAQCAERNNLIRSITQQVSESLKQWIDIPVLIEKDREKIKLACERMLSNKIDDSVQETISKLKTQLEEALKSLSSSVSQFPSGLIKNTLVRNFESIKQVGYLADTIKAAQALRIEVDQAFHTCKQSIQQYEERLPQNLRKNSLLAITTELPSVSSHHATTYSEKKVELPKEPPKTTLQNTEEQSTNSSSRPFCSLM